MRGLRELRHLCVASRSFFSRPKLQTALNSLQIFHQTLIFEEILNEGHFRFSEIFFCISYCKSYCVMRFQIILKGISGIEIPKILQINKYGYYYI